MTRQDSKTVMEKRLQTLWAKVLKLDADTINAEDSFLELGGNSISMIRLVGTASKQGLRFSVADIFRHPRLRELAQQAKSDESQDVEIISPFSLLGPRLNKQRAQQHAARLCDVAANQVKDIFPCTSLQQGLLAMTAKRGEDYVARSVFELPSSIDIDRFTRAWEKIVVTLPILRTRIVDFFDRGLVQVEVDEQLKWQQGNDLDIYIQNDKNRTIGPGSKLSRYALIKDCRLSTFFVWTVHHALYDGWSYPLILKAVQQAYDKVQLPDFVPFQRFVKSIQDVDPEAAVQFWQGQLAGSEAVCFPALPSPTYQPSTDCIFKHGVTALQWPRNDITASTVVRATWALLLATLTGTKDAVFGVTVSGRQAAVSGIDTIVGPTIATVPVRVLLRPEMSVRQLLQRVQTQSFEMTNFEQFGLSSIRRMNAEMEQNSQFQTLLVVQPAQTDDGGHGALFENSQAEDGAEIYDAFSTYAMTVVGSLQDQGLEIKVNFDSNVIKRPVVKEMIEQFDHILRQLCKDDSMKIRDLEVVSQQDLNRIWRWNQILPPTIEAYMHDMITDTARRHPKANAIDAWDGKVSYEQLEDLSTRLALSLMDQGVETATRVLLCFEKSMWMPIAMLAVLKTGGTFVPLDPSQNFQQIEPIVEESDLDLVLTSTRYANIMKHQFCQVIALDQATMSSLQRESTTLRFNRTSLENAAYIIFTSGSTGRPKGVTIGHSALSTGCWSHGAIMNLEINSRVLQFASYAFDASIMEILTTLLYGGCVCVPSEDDRLQNLTKIIHGMAINTVLLTPSVAQLLEPTQVSTLTTLILGGEPVLESHVKRWDKLTKVLVAYGPAECTVISTMHVITQTSSSQIIGKGVGCVCWVVNPDNHDRLIPVGAVGELLLEGPILAQGYLNNEELTVAAFIKDPSWLLKGNGESSEGNGRQGRLYKTGDLVRYDTDGSSIFVGRKDMQIKIRGQRAELGGIEYHIRQFLSREGAENPTSNVQIITEMITCQGSSNSILAIFICLSVQSESESMKRHQTAIMNTLTTSIWDYLIEKIPAYMIPNAFIPVDAIPLTVTGKVDRRRLREIGSTLTHEDLAVLSAAERSRPATGMEQQLQGLWAAVLNVERDAISANDSFFYLGGDSISAMRLVGVAREQGLLLTVADIFRYPKLYKLAERLKPDSEQAEVIKDIAPFSLLSPDSDKEHTKQNAAAFCNIDSESITDVFPCTPLQQGLLALTSKASGSYIARWVWELLPNVDLKRFKEAWEETVSIMAILRTRIADVDQGLVQLVVDEPPSWSEADDLDEYIQDDKKQGMGPGDVLSRFAMIQNRRRGSKTFFIWTIHHALYDGHLFPLILDNIQRIYVRQTPTPADFYVPFQKFIQSILETDQEAAASFWRSQFANATKPPFPTLPSPNYQPQANEIFGMTITGISRKRSDITISTVIRAAWALLLSRYCNTAEVVFGATITGRQAAVPGIERIVGPTIATVPVRLILNADDAVMKLLQRVQTQATDMIPFEQTGLAQIRRLGDDAQQACSFQTLLLVEMSQGENKADILFNMAAEDETKRENAIADAFSTYAIMLVCQVRDQSLRLRFSYDSAVVKQALVKRMAQQFERIVQQLCAEDHQAVTLKDIKTASEQDLQDIWELNKSVPSAVEMCVHDLIAQTTVCQPEATAICAWDGELTYRELDELSTRLAHCLIENGVDVNTIVMLCFGKSLSMPVATLAVMKAGAASVAIDVSQPQERLQLIAHQVSPRVVLSSWATQQLANGLAGCPVIIVEDSLQRQSSSIDQPLPLVNSSSMLYIVFTSGSTGTPKGVVITHRNFSSAIEYQNETMQFTKDSRVLDFASYAFDLAWYNLLQTLIAGACLCVPSDTQRKGDIAECIHQYNVSYANLTPSILSSMSSAAILALQTLVLVGEPVTPQTLALCDPQTQVFNLYGPSECTPCSTATRIEARSNEKVPIGKGLGLCTWVVDSLSGSQLVPWGCVGELWLEGPLIGLGYFNDPTRTAASFVEDPQWLLQGAGDKHPGRSARLYKTGDLVYYNADGSLIFVGRKDTQVKIRGQRVELSEVEHHVQKFLNNRDMNFQVLAEVIELQGSNKSAALVAFVCPDAANSIMEEDQSATLKRMTKEIQEHLAQTVPSYMIPSALLPLKTVPLISTGKADRQRLRAIGSSIYFDYQLDYRHGRLAPSNQQESILCDVWSEVLNLPTENISMDVPFTRLGGDSISGMQVVSRCRARNLKISLESLLRDQTVQLVARHSTIATYISPVAVKNVEGHVWQLSPIQQLFFDNHPQGHNHFNQSFILRFKRRVSGYTLEKALQSLVIRHSMLRARFRQNRNNVWEQFVAKIQPQAYAFSEHDLDQESALFGIVKNRHEALNILDGPVFAADLFNISGNLQVLFLVAHHLVVDLVSWRVLLHELEQTLTTKEVSFSETLPFQIWSKLQYQDSQRLHPARVMPFQIDATGFEFWGVPTHENKYQEAVHYQASLDKPTTSLLVGAANDSLRTEPADILSATIVHSFRSAFPNRKAPVLFFEGHGRERLGDSEIDLSGTVGWFTTLHPLDIPGEASDTEIDVVKFAKDTRHRIPGKGRPYFAYRYHNVRGREEFKEHAAMELLFNYTGANQQLESPKSLFQLMDASESSMLDNVSSTAQRLAMIEVTASIERGALIVSFGFNRKMQHQNQLKKWIDIFTQSLRVTVASLVGRRKEWTLSDFPLLPLNYGDLDLLIKDYLPKASIALENIEDMYPCTPIQKGILLSRQKGVASYATFWVWHCKLMARTETISPARVLEAWRKVVHKHSILASAFVEHPEGGGFIQVLLRDPQLELRYISDSTGRLGGGLLDAERPSFRAGRPEHAFTVCAGSNGKVYCRLDISHALMDAASMAILLNNISQAYSDLEPSPAPSFRHLVQYIESKEQSEGRRYWSQYMQGVQTCEFPVDDISPEIDAHGHITLPISAMSGIDEFCRENEIRRSAFFQVAWAFVLSQCTGMSEVCFGYLVSDRDAPIDNIGTMVGPLINMLASRVHLSRPLEEIFTAMSEHSIKQFEFRHTHLTEIPGGSVLNGRRIYNTAVNVLESASNRWTGDEKIQFDEVGADDPHEYDMVLIVGSRNNESVVTISYRKQTFSERIAQDALTSLDSAIAYLLSMGGAKTDKPGCQSVGCARKGLPMLSWHKTLMLSDLYKFPPLPSNHSPQIDREVIFDFEDCLAVCDDYAAWTIIQAAWSILLDRYIGINEVAFSTALDHQGTSVGGEEYARASAFAILPMRAEVDTNTSIQGLLGQIEDQTAEFGPIELLDMQSICHLNKGAARDHQTRTLLVVQPAHSHARDQYSTTPIDRIELGETTCKKNAFDIFALVLVCQLRNQDVHMQIRFDSTAIEQSILERMAQSFGHILRQLSAAKRQITKVSDIEATSVQDLQNIWNWNATVPNTVKACVHDLIAERAQKQPGAPAICAWDGNLTYSELDTLSSQLAFYLIDELGMKPGQIVLLFFEKSKWMPVAMLSIMKAGGVSIALDTTFPDNRLQSIMIQAQASMILSSTEKKKMAHRLAGGMVVIAIEKHLEALASPNKQKKLPRVDPSLPIYIVFTSGSTGTPKGVIVSHRNSYSAVVYQQTALGFEKTSRVYDFASYAFDAVWLIFLNTLTSGGCLCIPSDEARRNDIAGSMRAMQVTYAHLTPSVARFIGPSAVPSLKTLVLGGEPMTQEDVNVWGSHVILYNNYGPAECTPAATSVLVSPQTKHVGNIGRGQGLVTWVVHRDGQQLAPIGGVGELWLEGPLVGAGYLNDSDRTAAAFVNDPPWLLRGAAGHSGRRGRLYRTGDLVKYDLDGSLIFIGRNDSQVKIRGQRVELSEVENHVRDGLANYGISASVVAEMIVLIESSAPSLVAFVSVHHTRNESSGNDGPLLAGIWERLEAKLSELIPAYMIPRLFIPIETFPITATGKMDRRRLRKMGESLTSEQLAMLKPSKSGQRLPSTEKERLLQQLWAKVLRIDASGVNADDNFLHSGGDSIRAMQLVAAAQEQGLSITVANVFKQPQLCNLAETASWNHEHTSTEFDAFSLLKPGLNADEACIQAASLCGIDYDKVIDIFPCTPLQEGLITMTIKRSSDYMFRVILELEENTDVGRLKMAWQKAGSTASILRTRIVDLAGQGLVQVVIDEPLQWVVGHTDLQLYVNHDKHRQVDLGTPLTWSGIVEDGLNKKIFFVWTVHHALYDGWSIPLVLKEVERIYEGESQQPHCPFQLFVQHILDIDEEQASSFWQSQLARCEATVFPELPLASYQPLADQVVQRQITALKWPYRDITASTIVRAAWSLLVARYTNSNDVVFGATVTGRQAAVPGVQNMIGPTIATVPIRVILDWAAPVINLLQDLQAQALEMTTFEQTGLQRIRRISPEIEQSSQFQSLLVIQPLEQDERSDDKKSLWSHNAEYGTKEDLNAFNTYAMMAVCQLEASGLDIQISFDSKVIPATQVQRIIGQLELLLQHLCAESNYHTKLADINLVSKQELCDIWKWNTMTVPDPVETCVHDLIAKTAREQPKSLAISAWDGDLTYDNLDSLSTQLGLYLVSLGIKSGQVIPLCFEKSMWTSVAIVGVMKVGCASVLMDTSLPEERLRIILNQTHSRWIISSVVNETLACRLLSDSAAIVAQSVLEESHLDLTNVSLPSSIPHSPLLVLFTSGSTGVPKGVVINHLAFATAVKYQSAMFQIAPGERVYDFASYSFDIAWFNVLQSLANGACLCVPSDFERKNELQKSIARWKPTIAFLTPSVARLLEPASCPSIQCLALGGEPQNWADFSNWPERVRKLTVYGPAECTVVAAVADAHILQDQGMLIGPATATNTWILDPIDGHHLMPIGTVGELWLEGPLVGDGYLHDPEKTVTAFVKDPDWLLAGGPNHPGRTGRLYKTGDLMKYREDGTLVSMGRKDTQVKIRGQRVELAEVEHHLSGMLNAMGWKGSSRAVAEIITPRDTDKPILVAFILIAGSAQDIPKVHPESWLQEKAAELDDKLAQLLPTYMRPSAYIPIKKLPMTTNGKLDRKALRGHAAKFTVQEISNLSTSRKKRHAPKNPKEQILRDVWSDVLNIDAKDIPLDVSFIRLGGDSIRAMQVVSRCRSKGISTNVSAIMTFETIERLSKACTFQVTPTTKLEQERLNQPFDLSPIQEAFFEWQTQDINHYNQSFLLGIRRQYPSTIIQEAFTELVDRHSMLRARFRQTVPGRWQQIILPGGEGTYRFTNHQVSTKEEVHSVAQNQQSQLNISEGPVYAVDLFELPSGQQFISMTAHHLVVDLVSWRIIWHEIERRLAKNYSPLPMVSFQSWCKWQQEYGRKLEPDKVLPYTVQNTNLDYWGLSPSDRTYGNCMISTKHLDSESTRIILGQSDTYPQIEPVDVLLACLLRSFSDCGCFRDRKPPAIFLEGHGRERLGNEVDVDLSETIGWFTTLCPLQVPEHVNLDAMKTLKAVRDQRRRLPGNGLPYFTCSHYSTARRRAFPDHTNLEVVFNYTGHFQQLERPDGLFMRAESQGVDSFLQVTSKNAHRPSLLDVHAVLNEGKMEISFIYPKTMSKRPDVEKWMESYLETLESVSALVSANPLQHSSSDYPLLENSNPGLETLEKRLFEIGIETRNIQDLYPCTPMQEDIYLSATKGNRLYEPIFVWKCTHSSDEEVLRADHLISAWQATVQRHDILRTVFVDHPESNQRIQVVLADVTAKVNYFKEDTDDPATFLSRRSRPNLSLKEPWHVFSVCQGIDNTVTCRLDIHHMLCDAASMAILLTDISKAYAGVVMRPSKQIRELIKCISRTSNEDKLSYWANLLTGIQPCQIPSDLPLDKHESLQPPPEIHSSIQLNTSPRISEFCLHINSTRSTLIQTAWALVLTTFTKETTVCFGYLVSGRDADHEDVESTVGPYISTLIAVIDTNQPTIKDVLQTTHAQIAQSLNFQHTSVAEIQRRVGSKGEALFNTNMTVRDNFERDVNTLEGLRFCPVGGEDPYESDVTVRASLDREATYLQLTYRGRRISQKLAKELAFTMETAIEYILRFGDLSSGEAETPISNGSSTGNEHLDLTPSLANGSRSAAGGFLGHLTGIKVGK